MSSLAKLQLQQPLLVFDGARNNIDMHKRKKEEILSMSQCNSSAVHDSVSPRKRGKPSSSKINSGTVDLSSIQENNSDDDSQTFLGTTEAHSHAGSEDADSNITAPKPKAREIRLEQNRKAARESRRRKKVMVEELQRSVIFFTRTNCTLKQQNDEFQRLLVTAQAKIQSMKQCESDSTKYFNEEIEKPTDNSNSRSGSNTNTPVQEAVSAGRSEVATANALTTAQSQATFQYQVQNTAQAQAAHAAATQAMYESKGFPPAAARAAAQTLVAGATASGNLPAPTTSLNESPAAYPTKAYPTKTNDQESMQKAQSKSDVTANPYMEAMMKTAAQHNTASPAQLSCVSPPTPASTLNPINAMNQFLMYQQFMTQLGSMGCVMPNLAVSYPSLFQQQMAAMQLQMSTTVGGQLGTMVESLPVATTQEEKSLRSNQ